MSEEEEYQSNKEFLQEIGEYQFGTYKVKIDSYNETNGNEDEIDNLMQEIQDLKEELEVERGKSKSLSHVINEQHKVIEAFQKNTECEKPSKQTNEIRYRYWNRGLCKEGDE